MPEYAISPQRNKRIVVDGALIDDFRLTHGYWEAKDIDDNLPAEVKRKFAAGYPRDNILFQSPQRAILGTLFERGRDPAKRAQLGAHYTDSAEAPTTWTTYSCSAPPATA